MRSIEYQREQTVVYSTCGASQQTGTQTIDAEFTQMSAFGAPMALGRVGEWAGGRAMLVEREPRSPMTEFSHCVAQHTVALHLEGVNTRTAISYDGGVTNLGGGTLGQVMFIPASHRVDGWSDYRTRIRHVVILLDPEIIQTEMRASAGGVDELEIPFCRDVGDGVIANRMRELQSELENPALLSRLYVESLTCEIATRLVRRHANRVEPIKRGGLPPRRLRLVKDYIEENLPNEITLGDLAKIASVSPTHFCRAFHKSAGISSHQYILRKRVERAKELLATGSMPIAEIALASGFSDQSHLTKQFRNLVGTTPWRFRNEA